jgi:hypothetical protein
MGEPNGASKLQASPVHDRSDAEFTGGGNARHPNVPAFPIEQTERLIEICSRWAGPLAFMLALAGITWLVLR